MPAQAPVAPAADAMLTRGPDSNPPAAAAAIDQARWAEEQLDRTEREGERERLRALAVPQPVAPGAFDGTTSDRNR
jgi:hypothetical protein